jgi:outer membrane biosynthesis protein TonB
LIVNWRQFSGMLLALTLMVGASGCKLRKKKPNLPQQAQAPTVRTTAEPPPTQPGPAPPASVEPSRPLPTPGEVATETPPPTTPKPKQHVAKKTNPPATKKPVVESTTTPPPPAPQSQTQGPLTASIGHNDVARQTQQMLDESEKIVSGLNRSLSDDEQAIVAHIRSYVSQSKGAMNDGDYDRAHNLAIKAHLLADELAKK